MGFIKKCNFLIVVMMAISVATQAAMDSAIGKKTGEANETSGASETAGENAAVAIVTPEVIAVTPVHHAMLSEREAKLYTALRSAIEKSDCVKAQKELERGANPNIRDDKNNTLFYDLVHTLNTTTADVCEADPVAYAQQTEMLKILYSFGGDDSKLTPDLLCFDALQAIVTADREFSEHSRDLYWYLDCKPHKRALSCSWGIFLPSICVQDIRGYLGDGSAMQQNTLLPDLFLPEPLVSIVKDYIGDIDVSAQHPLKLRSDMWPKSVQDKASLLIEATRRGKANQLREILEALYVGADVSARSSIARDQGMTSLHIAAHLGYERVVELLLSNRANIEVRHWHDYTPLFWAVYQGREEVVRLLLKKKANVEARTKQARTFLVVAREWKREAIVQLLLDAGAKE